jgi:hypothetical protein
VYSINKEDIWVSRVPLPVKADETRETIRGFDDWNLYVPKWASAAVVGDELRLQNRDPHDYVRATRVFPDSRNVNVTFDLLAEQENGSLEAEILTKFGSRVRASVRASELSLRANEWKRVELDATTQEPDELLNRLSIRTGSYRNIGGANPVQVESDRPHSPYRFRVRHLQINAL